MINHIHTWIFCKKLDVAWKHLGQMKTIPLSKGLYEFTFSSLDDMRMILTIEIWNLSLEILHVFAWTKDFLLLEYEIYLFIFFMFWFRQRTLSLHLWNWQNLNFGFVYIAFLWNIRNRMWFFHCTWNWHTFIFGLLHQK